MNMPEAGTELINQRPLAVRYRERKTEMTTGKTRLHAIRIDSTDVAAVCGTATYRVLPQGTSWYADYPDHLVRCTACTSMYPLSTA